MNVALAGDVTLKQVRLRWECSCGTVVEEFRQYLDWMPEPDTRYCVNHGEPWVMRCHMSVEEATP